MPSDTEMPRRGNCLPGVALAVGKRPGDESGLPGLPRKFVLRNLTRTLLEKRRLGLQQFLRVLIQRWFVALPVRECACARGGVARAPGRLSG